MNLFLGLAKIGVYKAPLRKLMKIKISAGSFAIIDDIGGIIVIAFFYSSSISFAYLGVALLCLLLMYAGGKMGITSKLFYMIGFFLVWCMMLHSGIHPTIAGVLSALTIPARPKLNLATYITNLKSSVERLPDNQVQARLLSNSELSVMKYIESVSDKAISPLQSLDDNLGPTVNYFVLPIFAFANAGISFDGFSFSTIGSVSLAVFLGLVIGKSMGIFLFTWTAISSKLFKMPKYLNYKLLFGVSILGGIGFTVSLFIASLAYGGTEPQLLNDAKMGIIFGSLFAGVSGFLYLKKALST